MQPCSFLLYFTWWYPVGISKSELGWTLSTTRRESHATTGIPADKTRWDATSTWTEPAKWPKETMGFRQHSACCKETARNRRGFMILTFLLRFCISLKRKANYLYVETWRFSFCNTHTASMYLKHYVGLEIQDGWHQTGSVNILACRHYSKINIPIRRLSKICVIVELPAHYWGDDLATSNAFLNIKLTDDIFWLARLKVWVLRLAGFCPPCWIFSSRMHLSE